ncbi:hypothetical protein FG386_001135 [Cryptosporidium ryanae]|uniref:uncharacterized protein n=1 Tax=Cryptosporidium ryanae TaxID=515981 RepID=UPI003519DCBF|nr:hypothetical protein FG386_001135 [Cryptosporidium ryanae]
MYRRDENNKYKNENTPHYYYQRSVQLEEELKLIQLKLSKLQTENQRNDEIFKSHIKVLTNSIKKQESILFELEQYKYICNTGVAIICRFCGEVVLICSVMQHLIEFHFFNPAVMDKSDLSSNLIFLKNQLENRSNIEEIGSKCFEYVIQDKKESELLDLKVSFISSDKITIYLHETDKKMNKSINSTLKEIYKFNLQVNFYFLFLNYTFTLSFRFVKRSQKFQYRK